MDENLNCSYVDQALQREFITKANRYLGITGDALEAIAQAIDKITADEGLRAMLELHHYLIFDSTCSQNNESEKFRIIKEDDWSYIHLKMGVYADLYPLVILLSGISHLLDYYKEKTIPNDIIVDTLSDVNMWLNDYYVRMGKWGIDNFSWFMNHFLGKLYRLGRLQFVQHYFTGQIQVYRNRYSKEVIALSKGGIKYRSDGQINGTNGIFEDKGIWLSSFTEGEDFVSGNPILPVGNASQKIIRLSKSVWKEELSQNDDILEVHIPAGEKLSLPLCEQSFRKAIDFFSKYFPDFRFKGFACASWLLGPPLREVLPASSNIIQFQHRFYLYPFLSDDGSVFARVFGQRAVDLNKVHQDTTLQRAIVAYVKKGKHLRAGAGFILKLEIEDWDTRLYESQKWLKNLERMIDVC